MPFNARSGLSRRPHEAAARILDDMRFLIGLVLALSEDDHPSPKDLQKIQTTSRWIYDRISGLPAEAPPVSRQNHHHAEEVLSPASAASTARPSTFPGPSHPRSRSPGQHSPQDLYPPGPGSWPQGSNSSSAHARDSFTSGTDYFTRDAASPSPTLADADQADNDADADASTTTTTMTATPPPDMIYQAVRQSALIYSRAIMLRRPLRDAAVCSGEDFLGLWTTVWRVPLHGWRAFLGVFVWVLLCITPASRGTPHERFVKGMLEVGLVQMALEEDGWAAADRGMAGALRLTRWLARRGEKRKKQKVGEGAAGYGSAFLNGLGVIVGGQELR